MYRPRSHSSTISAIHTPTSPNANHVPSSHAPKHIMIPHCEIRPAISGKRLSPLARSALMMIRLKLRPGSSSRPQQ